MNKLDYSIINSKIDLYNILYDIEHNNPNYNSRNFFSLMRMKFKNFILGENMLIQLKKKINSKGDGIFSITNNDYPYSKLLKNHNIKHLVVWNYMNKEFTEQYLETYVNNWLKTKLP